jgi:hypothetical protein
MIFPALVASARWQLFRWHSPRPARRRSILSSRIPPRRAPAASKAQVRGVGPAGKTVMVDMIAVTQ